MKTKNRYILKEIFYPIITLGVIFLCYFLLYKTNNFYPFSQNGKTVLMIDAQSEYIAYLRYLRNILLNGGSYIYTNSKVFGGDFLSIYTFYLASPFNFLLVFFNEQNLPAFILITSIIKMMFGGLFMYFLLRSKTKKNNLFLIAISVCYSLIAYSFVYQSNYMWLDAVMIIPLVILGLEKLQLKKMKWLYPISLAYALLSSWYTGAMICIFVVLYFIYLYFSKKKGERKKSDIIYFILFSISGGFLAGTWWISAFLHFSGTKVHSNFPTFKWYSISTFFHGFLYDGYSGVSSICQNEGYIPAFTSLVLLVYSIHFFFNKGYSLRFRLMNSILILFYFLMSTNSCTYTILHFGSVPTWFPSRYAFIYSFIICLYAFYQNEKMQDESILGFFLADIVIIGLLCITIFIKDDNKTTHKMDKLSIIIASVAIFVLMINIFVNKITVLKDKPKNILMTSMKCFAIPFAIYSSYLGGERIIQKNKLEYQDYQTYLEDDSYTNSVNLLKEYDNDSLYRMELNFNRDGNYNQIDNNPMFYSYNGLSHFSSSEIKEVEEYMSKIGFQYNGFFEKYDGGSTLSMNTYLGVKYLIDRDDNSRNKPQFYKQTPFNEITSIKSDISDIKYYQNEYALPFGYVVNYSDYSYVNEGVRLDDSQVYWYDHFEYQNEIYHEMTSLVYDDIFQAVNYSMLLNNVEVVSENVATKDFYFSGKKGSSIFFTFDNPEKDYPYNLYFCLKDYNQNFDIYIDGKKQSVYSYHFSGIRGFDTTKTHHTVLIYAKKDFTNQHIRPEIYLENINTLKQYYDVLYAQSAKDLKTSSSLFSYTYEGSFELQNENGMFMFTLPYEKDFSIYVDNKKVDLLKRFNIFSACSLKGYQKGTHTIKIVYQEKGLIMGGILSILGLFLLIFLILYINIFGNLRYQLTKNIDKKHLAIK